MIFKKPSNALEGHTRIEIKTISEEMEVSFSCPKCKKRIGGNELRENMHICPYCRYHFRIHARQRIDMICDENTFTETDKTLVSKNILHFPEYDNKLKTAMLESAEKDGVVCGICEIDKNKTALFVMEPFFMMGSMGSVVGEKITRLFEMAVSEHLPVVGFTVSGGARMQEGIISLMQMAKTSGAVKRHSDAGNLYVCVLTDPTTGGVTASFAMEGDIILAEPGALIGFAGPRVIEQTIHKKLPEEFQKAEFLLKKGFVDDIVDRRRQKGYIAKILNMHNRGAGYDCL
ncbi:MAG TPA: acetyl-CoA carboxylase carboxyl transferase subunit beta [Clostridiales bacterium]|jgi:acetyl-CoA carboxylase carboxyl transferase subunit beta|nr:acetyl-CoA carboxylase carboxyl transferase subunit beta [Clostridiales bacterium]HBE13775.1 acetyl-CoA carboxylase carboxyl transferase subunit beta [Clostridiales bacterium]